MYNYVVSLMMSYMRRYGITFRFLADIVDKPEKTVKQYFYRKEWSIKNIKNVQKYLTKFNPPTK